MGKHFSATTILNHFTLNEDCSDPDGNLRNICLNENIGILNKSNDNSTLD